MAEIIDVSRYFKNPIENTDVDYYVNYTEKSCLICKQIFEDISTNQSKETCSKKCRRVLYLSRIIDGQFKENVRQRICSLKRCGVIISNDDYFKIVTGLKRGVCESCGNTVFSFRNLHLDHNHETKKYRGAICMRCNITLGHVLDDSKILSDLIKYLKKEQISVK